MKKIIFYSLLIILSFSIKAQENKTALLQNLENNNASNQNSTTTATLKSSSRLFGAKDDLTTVILIIPSGSVVNVLGSDSTYLHVTFEEKEGYIFKNHAVIDKSAGKALQSNQQQQAPQEEQAVPVQQISRFSYLENKYGTSMAARLSSGKIWKGMNSEMVKDSWGNAEKINRVVSGNIIKEEWIFKYTWLYFENNTLVEWGPIKK
jgi:hypothetical protein